MSLEDRIAELTAAVKENNELLREAAAGRVEVLAAAKEATTKAKPAAKAAAEKSAETPAPAEKQAETPTPAAATGNKCQQAVIDYMAGTEGAEREARAAKVKEILGKVGVAKAGEVPADKEAAFIRTFDKLKEQGNLVKADEPAAEEEDFV